MSRERINVENVPERWVLAIKWVLGTIMAVIPAHLGLMVWLVTQTYGITQRVGMNEYKIEVSSVDRYSKIQADLDNAEQTAFLLDQIRKTNQETLAALKALAVEIREIDRRTLTIPSEE